MKKGISQFIYLVSIVVMSLTLMVSFYTARLLRPAADDYCYGSITAEYGFIGGIVRWFDSWSGFVLSTFTGSLFVGLPLANLSYEFASAIPFISTAIGMGITANFLITNASNDFSEKLSTIIFLAFGWWTYLWVSTTFGFDEHYSLPLANGLTFWQTLNGQYVIQLQVLLILLSVCMRNIKSSPIISIITGTIIGLIAGTAGTTLSLSLLSMTFALIILKKFYGVKSPSNEIHFYYLFCLGLVITLIACHFLSPGNLVRVKALNIHIDMSLGHIYSMTKTTISQGFLKWIKSYLNPGALVFLALTFGFYFFRGFRKKSPSPKNLIIFALLFSIFSLVQCFINRLSEFFSYQGYWHFVSPVVCSFISLYLFGLWGALIATNYNFQKYQLVFIRILYMLMIIVGLSTNVTMINSIKHRYSAWAIGAAPAKGVSDIEDQNGWQMRCWKKLEELRISDRKLRKAEIDLNSR